MQTYETTSLGCAIATFVAVGEYASVEEAMKAMSHKSDTFLPNPEAAEQYKFLYEKGYLEMYPGLKGVYRHLNKFTKRY